MTKTDVVIVGGGLAGLTCAVALHRRGLRFLLVEASDRVGGRVKTDRVDGFLLDHGFQVFLTSYPNAQNWLDLKALRLRNFAPGALIRGKSRFYEIGDPWRDPSRILQTAIAPVGTLGDKIRLGELRRRVLRNDVESCLTAPQESTLSRLRRDGFTEAMIDRFFRPFMGGVFLDRSLQTSSRMLEFTFRMFSSGHASLPAEGMEAIPRQLASQLPTSSLILGRTATKITANEVQLDDGSKVHSDAVVLATEATAANRLLDDSHRWQCQETTCAYFEAEHPPVDEPMLLLGGDQPGPIHNLCCPSRVQPTYAPLGRTLVSVTSVEREIADPVEWLAAVRKQLSQWFGTPAEKWRHLATYYIPFALPDQTCPQMEPVRLAPRLPNGIFRAGDYCDTRSIDGAIASGARAAEAVLAEVGVK